MGRTKNGKQKETTDIINTMTFSEYRKIKNIRCKTVHALTFSEHANIKTPNVKHQLT
jgi:hypothetical protein